jgi:two-component system KDP operon response regulator KdpE
MDSKTIMIVEDDRDLMLAMSVRLIAQGFTTIAAQDAASAIQLAATRKPDLILMDLGLPDSNGFVVMEVVSQLKSVSTVPIIVVSARPADVYREAALMAGAKDYFQKPFDNDALLNAIHRELHEEKHRLLEASNS